MVVMDNDVIVSCAHVQLYCGRVSLNKFVNQTSSCQNRNNSISYLLDIIIPSQSEDAAGYSIVKGRL